MSLEQKGRLLPEWLNENYHKSYPFDISTAAQAGAFPTTFLLDMQLLVGGPIDKDHTYISRMENDGSSISLFLATKNGEATVELGLLARVPLNTTPSTEIPVELKNGDAGVLMNGYVTVGITDINTMVPDAVREFTEEQTKIYPGVIIPVTNWTSGLVIDGQLISGNINLIAGKSVQFRADTIEVNGEKVPVVYVDCTDTTQYNGDITDDATLLEQVTSLYGSPIYTINGVSPDAKGNIQFKVVETSGEDDLPTPSVTLVGGTEGTLIFADNRTRPCCTLDDQQIIIDNIAAVNERAARIEGLITELETNLNSVSAQLAIISNQG